MTTRGPLPLPPPARGGGDILAAAWEARKLLRAARVGTLATSAQGQPFASLVTPACAPDLSLLLLLSDLSEHTRHLRAEPRCSVLVTGARSMRTRRLRRGFPSPGSLRQLPNRP